MAEVNVQGKACEFEVNDSVARAFVKLAKAYFALPGVQEDYERWEKEYDKRQAEKLTLGDNKFEEDNYNDC